MENPSLNKLKPTEQGENGDKNPPEFVSPKAHERMEDPWGMDLEMPLEMPSELIPESLTGPVLKEDDVINDVDEEFEEYCHNGIKFPVYIITPRVCNHQRDVNVRCACLKIYQPSLQDKKKPVFYFSECELNDLGAIDMEMRLRRFALLNQHDPAIKYRRHHMTLLALLVKDNQLVCDPAMDRNKFLRSLYNVREHFDDYTNHGQRDSMIDFEAQGAGDFLSELLGSMKSLIGTAAVGLKELITRVITKMFTALKGLFNLISETMAKLFDIILNKLVTLVYKAFDPISLMKNAYKNTRVNMLVVVIGTILTCVAIDIIGFLTVRLAERFLDTVISFLRTREEKVDPEGEYFSQGPATPLVGIVTMIGLILGLTASDMKTVSSRCTEFSKLVAGGVAVSCFASSLFMILPIALQTALVCKFSPEKKIEMDVDDWNDKATALIQMSKIPKLLIHQEFEDWLKLHILEGTKLKSLISNKHLNAIYLRNYVKLLSLQSTILNFREIKPTRDLPFSLHLAAPPGYGKTLIASRLVRDVTGLQDRDVYTVPIASEFWDAYINQKAIIIDEFLIGNSESRTLVAKSYLSLVSTLRFAPPMASVDDLTVGIKGTEAEPTIVVTANNNCYDQPPSGIDTRAFLRRRKYVLSIKINPAYAQYVNEHEIDFSKFTQDQIQQIDWVRIDILPSMPHSSRTALLDLTYQGAIQILRANYAEHLQLCATMKAAVNSDVPLERSPSEIYADVLRELRGVPNEPVSLWKTITTLLIESGDSIGKFFSQGPPAERKLPTRDEPDTFFSDNGSVQEDEIGATSSDAASELTPDSDNGESQTKSSNPIDDMEGFGLKISQLSDKAKKIRKMIQNLKRQASREAYISKFKLIQTQVDEFLQSDYPEKEGEYLLDRINANREHFLSLLRSTDAEATQLGNPAQKDGEFAYLDHSNVDPQNIHRHSCSSCKRHFAHKHDDRRPHLILCRECQNKGLKPKGRNIHGGFPLTKAQVDSTKGIDLFPADYDYEYLEESEEVRKELRKMWVEYAFDKSTSMFTAPICYVDASGLDPTKMHDREYLEENMWQETNWSELAKGHVKSTAKLVGSIVVLYTIIKSAKALFGGGAEKEEDTICFSAQSEPPAHRSRPAQRARKLYVNNATRAQGPATFSFTINGANHLGIPIKGRTFMTYHHAFFDSDFNIIKDNTLMKVQYNGSAVEFPFKSEDLRAHVETDVAFYKMPHDVKLNSFPDVIRKFWTHHDANEFVKGSAMLKGHVSSYVQVNKVRNQNYVHSGEFKTHMPEALAYPFPTKKGDCGTLLMSVGSDAPGRYMGMHVAGGTREKGSFFGLAVIVTQEDVMDAFSIDTYEIDDVDFKSQGSDCPFEGPNLVKAEQISRSEEVHLNRKTKIQSSIISAELEWPAEKHLPLLSRLDERSNQEDPLINMINDTLSVTPPPVDDAVVEMVYESMEKFYREKLVWNVERRRLTFVEACAGIPGVLASLKVNTSAGYPLCKASRQRGKRDYFWFDERGEFNYEPEFRKYVEEFVEKCDREPLDEGRFLVFLKDELASQAKIDSRKCRVIYAGDVVASVGFRMVFGSMLAAFNSSYHNTPSSIGLNQYSHDMHVIYDYLSQVGDNFVAGDFKNFDKRTHPKFLEASYNLLMNIAGDLASPMLQQNFIQHQRFSPCQVMGWKLYLKSTHFSGCFFTTIVNNLVNEGYMRYVFTKHSPQHRFEKEVRCKYLGDDHIFAFSDQVKGKYTPIELGKYFSELGQIYTSDDKLAELTDDFRSFDQITFLGAHPKLLFGQYAGALKKATLKESPHWTRNNNVTLLDECESMMEMSSLWGKEFFEDYCNKINNALEQQGYPRIEMPACKQMAKTVCARTAASRADWPYGFFAQGPGPENSLVRLNEDQIVDREPIGNSNGAFKLAKKGLNEENMKLDFGTESRVFRGEQTWTTSMPQDTVILSVSAPFGLLSLGDPDNLQNMPFDRFLYWQGDVEVQIQVNGTQFQQGMLGLYFVPLADYDVEGTNVYTLDPVILSPGESSTGILKIPFRYFRNVMNTRARSEESLGTVKLVVLSPLAAVELTEITISVTTSFPNSKFTIPRNLDHTVRARKFYKVTGSEEIRRVLQKRDLKETSVAQGANQSSTINNTYSNVSGMMPITDVINSNTPSLGQETDIAADVQIPMPLDNPPLCSGGIPIVPSFPGMSASHGIRPTTDMQLMPAVFSRQQMEIFNPAETKIQTLLSKSCLLRDFTLTNTEISDTELYAIQLNSRMGLAEGENIPLNVAVLNQFMFWRSDIEFTIMAVKTKFHSTRLQGIIAYGAADIVAGSVNVNYSNIMNYALEESVHKWVIPWNAQTEFLRTYEGEGVVDPVQNYSLGQLSLILRNILIAPDNVVPFVNFKIFIRFTNSKVAVPRAYSPFTFNNYLRIGLPTYILVNTGPLGTPINGEVLLANSPNGVITVSSVTFPSTVDWLGAVPPLLTILTPSEPLQQVTVIINVLGIITTSRYVVDYVNTMTNSIQIALTTPIYLGGSTAMNTQVDVGSLSLVATVTAEAEAQGPELESSIQEPAAPPQEVVTKQQSIDRPNIPCKTEVGEKFEFCVSDIHEVGRRYLRMKPARNNDLDQFVKITQNYASTDTIIFNFGSQPQNIFRALYAAWAGSVKYRIFQGSSSHVTQAAFIPFANQRNAIPGIPLFDPVEGEVFVYGDERVTTNSAIAGSMAREVFFPISNLGYIDISAPFQSHFNFCYNSKTQEVAPISSGTISISSATDDEPFIMTAFGDDLRLGIFRPPRTTAFDLTGYTGGVAGFY